MVATMESTNLLLFGDQTVEKLSAIQSLVRHSKTSHTAREFLQRATDVVQLEFSRLSAEERGRPLEIQSLLGLAEENIKRTEPNGIVATVLMYIGRLGELIVFSEEDPMVLGSERSPTEMLAFCTGMLPAAVAAAARDTSELLSIGVEVISIVFRLVCEVTRRMRLVEDAAGHWATTILGVRRNQTQIILDDFHTSQDIPEPRKLAIGVVASDWLTLIGPPSSLKRLWNWSPELDKATKIPTDTSGPIHTTHIPPIDINRVLGNSSVLDLHISSKARIMRNSVKGVFTESTLGSLLGEMLAEIAHKPLMLSDTIETCLNDLPSKRNVKLTVVGPTGHLPTVKRALSEKQINFDYSQHSQHHGTLARGGSDHIAIVGMSGRFPASQTVEGFWEHLLAGKSFIREVPKSRFDLEEFYDATGKKKNSTKARHGSWLDQPGLFDNKLFNISPREAAQMDPVQRLLLTTSYEALEIAGYSPAATPATCSNRIATYFGQISEDWREVLNNEGVDIYYVPGMTRSFGPSRLNYNYKWGGGSFCVDSACATSTTAISLACSALKARECDTALAGGGSVLVSPNSFSGLSKSGMISSTGGCRTYHDDADGYARGEAVGVVVLKRLEDAVRDNDNILGVIRGAARTYCSAATSITHPDGEAQKRVFEAVLQQTCVNTQDISYVEMHGTGTQAGDAIEMTSVLQGVGHGRTKENPLVVGAVKANVGHGEAAAGVTSLIKVLMMMRDKLVPSQPDMPFEINRNFPPLKKLNVHIACKDMKLNPRPGGDGKVKVLLNSFDATGGNTSLLIEDAPKSVRKMEDVRPYHTVALSARSSTSLQGNIQRLLEHLERHTETKLADLAYTTTARRMHQPIRATYSVANISELMKLLRTDRSKQPTKEAGRKNGNSHVIYTFTGQGVQCVAMGKNLYEQSPAFRTLLESYQEMVVMQGLPRFIDIISDGCPNLSTEPPSRVHLAIVALEIALAQLLRAWGIVPDLVMGHSLGEYAALAVSGALSIGDTLYLVGQRALLIEKHLRPGEFAMLAVQRDANEARVLLKDANLKSAEIACVNSPTVTVISSTRSEAEVLQKRLKERGVKATLLNVPYGFHSKQVEPILQAYEDIAEAVVFTKPTLPIASTLLGEVVKSESIFTPAYLARQAREPVNFLGALHATEKAGFVPDRTQWVELGPEPILSGLVRATFNAAPERVSSVLKGSENNWKSMSALLAALHQLGVSINWPEYHKDFGTSLSLLRLPTYAFDEKDYWTPYREQPRIPIPEKASPSVTNTPSLAPGFISPSLQRIESEEMKGDEIKITFASHTSQNDLFAAIKGHLVDGITICPLSVFCDMAFTAAKYARSKMQPHKQAPRMSLRDIELSRPLIVEDVNPSQIVKIYTSYSAKSNLVRISFSSTDGSSVLQHGECEVLFEDNQEWVSSLNQTLFLLKSRIALLKDSAKSGNAHRLLKPMVYRLFENLVKYGEKYKALDEVLIDAEYQDAVGKVTLPSMEGAGNFQYSPYWIDSSVHLAGFLLNGSMKYPEDVGCLSTGFRSWRSLKELSPGKTYTSYVCMQETKGSSTITGDAYVFDSEDLVLAAMGIKFQKMTRKVIRSVLLPAGQKHRSGPSADALHAKLNPGNFGAVPIAKTPVKKESAPVTRPGSLTSSSRRSSYSGSSQEGNTATPASDEMTPDIINKLLLAVAAESGCAIEDMEEETEFADIGLDSLMAITTIANFRDDVGIELPATFFIDNPTIGMARAALELDSDASSEASVIIEPIKAIASPPLLKTAPVIEVTAIDTFFDEKLKKAPVMEVTEVDSASEGEGEMTEIPTPPLIKSPAPAKTQTSVPAKVTVLQGSDAPDKTKIFLMPDWSGSSASYVPLPSLGSRLCVYGVESPYKKDENTNWSVDDMTDSLLAAVEEKQPTGPYVLGGVSFGALYAYEVSRKLLEKGSHVQGLLLLDMFVPKGDTTSATSQATMTSELEKAGYIPLSKRMTKTQKTHLESTIKAHMNSTARQSGASRQTPTKTTLILSKPKSATSISSWLGDKSVLQSWEEIVGEVDCREVVAERQALMRYPQVNVLGQQCIEAIEGFLEVSVV